MLFFPDLSQQQCLFPLVIEKKLLGLLYWFVLNLEAACQQWSRTLNVSAAERPWQLAVTVTLDCDLPVHSVHAEVASAERSPLPKPPHHSPQMTVYPEMINGEASHDLFVLCNRMEQAVKHSFEDKVIWNDEPGEFWALCFNSFDRDLTCFRLLNLNLFTDRFATHQNVTNILGLLRKPGPQQRLQLPQTSGLHAGKQDSTNRWSSLFSHFPYGSIWQLPYSTSSL